MAFNNESRHVKSADEDLDKHIDQIYQYMQTYEALIIDIQSEAKKFRDENLVLRENLAAVVSENNRLMAQSANDSLGVFRNNYIKVAEFIFNSLRSKIFLVKKERDMFERMWSKTEAMLKLEVPISFVYQLKEKHSFEIDHLNKELTTAKSNNEVQNNINKILQANTRRLMVKFQTEKKVLIERLRTTETEKAEIRKCLVKSDELSREHEQKSNEIFQKLKETIQLADDAIAEINVLQREKNQREVECNSLAFSISSVIEDASERIDKDIEDLKMMHKKEVESCKSEVQHLKKKIKLEFEKKYLAHKQLKAFEDKMKLVETANSFLRKELESANKEKISTNNKMSTVKQSQTVGENYSSQKEIVELKKIIDKNRVSRSKLKVLFVEITKKLEERISLLVIENQKLKLSN